MSGMLSIVATPIGNLDDLSPRASRALAEADVIACEDTRVTRKLLSRVATRAKLVSYRSANERAVARDLADHVAGGSHVTLVTDAGTPGVSDPGHHLIDECVSRGLRIEIVPGPSAAVAALVVSGLPSARFVFEGFLPHHRATRIERLKALADEQRTLVLFEAPHRIQTTLLDIAATLGPERRIAMAREMTKIHEEVIRSTVGELCEKVQASKPRGEITLVIEGAAPREAELDDDALAAMVEEAVLRGCTRKDAVAEVAAGTGIARNRVYQASLKAL